MSRTALLLVVMLGARSDPCGTDTVALGLGGPCTRSSDCYKGLLCLSGVCELPDASAPADGGSSDAEANDAHDADAAH